jgi:hypothetical protein
MLLTTALDLAMNEIKNNYSDLNYAQFRTETEHFNHIKALVKEGAAPKKRIKVKGD